MIKFEIEFNLIKSPLYFLQKFAILFTNCPNDSTKKTSLKKPEQTNCCRGCENSMDELKKFLRINKNEWYAY